jgi:hypothetical protein
MQRLALMMAVMMLGMPPVNGYHTSVGPGEQGTRNQAESMFPPSAWFDNSGGTLATEKGVGSASLNGSPPVETGGFSVRWILQQVQRGMEGLTKVKEEVQRVDQEATRRSPGDREWNPGTGESGTLTFLLFRSASLLLSSLYTRSFPPLISLVRAFPVILPIRKIMKNILLYAAPLPF